MNISSVSIAPFDPITVSRATYNWVIGSVGYESRSRYLFENHAVTTTHRVAFIFDSQREIAFTKNRRFFDSQGFQELNIRDQVKEDSETVRKLFSEIHNSSLKLQSESLSLLLDISSMTRQMIALLCFKLAECAHALSITIRCDFVYSLAKFGELPELNGPIVTNGPVISELAGWCPNPGAQCGLILGIGYEEDLALGVIEELEAGAVWAFRPKNTDPRYDYAIDTHNRGLFETIPSSRLVRYTPREPYSLFVALNQLSRLSKNDFRILIVPFGPKLFALAACLVAISNYPAVGVWRVSAGPNLKPVDREPEGTLIGLTATFAHR